MTNAVNNNSTRGGAPTTSHGSDQTRVNNPALPHAPVQNNPASGQAPANNIQAPTGPVLTNPGQQGASAGQSVPGAPVVVQRPTSPRFPTMASFRNMVFGSTPALREESSRLYEILDSFTQLLQDLRELIAPGQTLDSRVREAQEAIDAHKTHELELKTYLEQDNLTDAQKNEALENYTKQLKEDSDLVSHKVNLLEHFYGALLRRTNKKEDLKVLRPMADVARKLAKEVKDKTGNAPTFDHVRFVGWRTRHGLPELYENPDVDDVISGPSHEDAPAPPMQQQGTHPSGQDEQPAASGRPAGSNAPAQSTNNVPVPAPVPVPVPAPSPQPSPTSNQATSGDSNVPSAAQMELDDLITELQSKSFPVNSNVSTGKNGEPVSNNATPKNSDSESADETNSENLESSSDDALELNPQYEVEITNASDESGYPSLNSSENQLPEIPPINDKRP